MKRKPLKGRPEKEQQMTLRKLTKLPVMLVIGLILGNCTTAITATEFIDRKQLCNSLNRLDQFKPSRSDTVETVAEISWVKAFFFDPRGGMCR